MVKVSVILSVYNSIEYIINCLNSILRQTLDEVEIICVDDASTDGTAVVLEEYNNHFDKVKLIRNAANKGAGESRNIGFQKAKGKYVIFLDSDDIFENDMLEKAYLRAEKYRSDICIFKEDQFVQEKEFIGYPYAHILMRFLEEKGCFSPLEVREMIFSLWNGWAWDKLFRRDFIIEHAVTFQNIRTSNDGYFVHSLIVSAQRLTYINEILVHHRINVEGSLSNTRTKSWENCYLYLKKLKAYLLKHHKYNDFRRSFVNWTSDFLYWNYQTLDEECREKLFYAMKEYIFDEFELSKYEKETFFNQFYYWYIHKIVNTSQYRVNILPVKEKEKYYYVYQLNADKINQLLQYLKEHHYRTGIWGAGERGQAFLNIYGMRKIIKYIFDQDEKKAGKVLSEGYIVQKFDKSLQNQVQCIIVMNSSHFQAIADMVKSYNKCIKVFDLSSYISLPLTLQECII